MMLAVLSALWFCRNTSPSVPSLKRLAVAVPLHSNVKVKLPRRFGNRSRVLLIIRPQNGIASSLSSLQRLATSVFRACCWSFGVSAIDMNLLPFLPCLIHAESQCSGGRTARCFNAAAVGGRSLQATS
jgi:hypothetical protein